MNMLPLRDTAYEALLQRILRGDLKPGAKLTEAKLSSELGVSRTPLREALFRLERDGLVYADMAKGYSVQKLTERDVREIYPIIASLELLALEESGSAIMTLLDQLEAINRDLGAARGNPTLAIETDGRWHDHLISRCPNNQVLSIITGLRYKIFRYETVYMSDTDLIDHSIQQHADIIGSLRRSDYPAAAKMLKYNYRFGMDAVILRLAALDSRRA
jgi:DNA-binding GntR family transcriptional regulator